METKIELQIGGMHCQSCAIRVEKALSCVEGVLSAQVNGATGVATVEIENPIDEHVLIHAVEQAGYQAAPVQLFVHDHVHKENYIPLAIVLVCAIPFVVMMVGMLFGFHSIILLWIQCALATAIQLIGGYGFYKDTYKALRNGYADMNVLIVMGSTAAWLLSTLSWLFGWNVPLYFESSVFIIAFVLIGRYLEARFKGKASTAIKKLLQLQPRTVHIEKNGKSIDGMIEDVVIGDILNVLVGERIPVDGVVVNGDAEVDESMVTGESLPAKKNLGDKVYAGTLNINGTLKAEAMEVGSNTFLAHIVKMVSQAQNSKPPAQKFADTISSWFVPAVIVLAFFTFILGILMGIGASQAAINAISVLVIACPCALGLAIPIVIVVAAGKAADMGILFKDAEVFEKTRLMKTLFVDKTGTLTSGAMEVSYLDGDQDFLSIVSSLESQLRHPLAQAIVTEAEKRNIPILPVEKFISYPGKGVEGFVKSWECGAGSIAFAKEKGIVFDPKKIEAHLYGNGTPIVVWKNKIFMGFLILTDQIRKSAATMVQGLKKLGIEVIMLTGDREQTAIAVAKTVGISKVFGGLLPQNKLEAITNAKKGNNIVGMVGDGINDAPALAAADVGIALEASTDVALESASIAILGGNLDNVVQTVKLSKITHKKIVENLFLAFVYNIIAIPLAMFGFLTPAIAAAAMAMSSVSVVLNALRLRF